MKEISFVFERFFSSFNFSSKIFITLALKHSSGVMISISSYKRNLFASYTPSVYISVADSGVAGGDATRLSSTIEIVGAASFTDISRDLTLGNVSSICIYATGSGGNNVVVRSIRITYR